jgi:molybdopterin-guanine dinucleotide biosynthesis protein A
MKNQEGGQFGMSFSPKKHPPLRPPPPPCSALLLAGGQGSRFGADKKTIELDGHNLTRTLLETLKTLFPEVFLSTNTPFAHPGVTSIADRLGAGPLAGIHAGLSACRQPWLYVTACDMPFLSPPLIQSALALLANSDGAAVLAYRRDPAPEPFIRPFPAFYHQSCLPAIQSALENSRYRIQPLFTLLTVRPLNDTLPPGASPDQLFYNINTREDLQNIAPW